MMNRYIINMTSTSWVRDCRLLCSRTNFYGLVGFLYPRKHNPKTTSISRFWISSIRVGLGFCSQSRFCSFGFLLKPLLAGALLSLASANASPWLCGWYRYGLQSNMTGFSDDAEDRFHHHHPLHLHRLTLQKAFLGVKQTRTEKPSNFKSKHTEAE